MALTEERIINVPGMLSRWVQLPTGARAHYMTSGETGPAVVLLHGGIAGSSGTAGWRFVAPFLGAHGFRVYCPDMPAFGLTQDPYGAYEYGMSSHTDFIQDFANALCLDAFHVSGNSMGCGDAVMYLVAHPERILSFALIAGGLGDLAPYNQEIALDKRAQSDRPNIQQFDGTAGSMRTMMNAIISRDDAIAEDLIAMRTEAANRHDDAYKRHMKRMMAWVQDAGDANEAARLRTKGRLETMTKPGIYLYGRKDELAPVEVGYFQEDAAPNIQFFYPDAGHQGQTDQPELFNQVFLEFFRDGKVSWETAQTAGISDRRPPLAEVVAVPATEGH